MDVNVTPDKRQIFLEGERLLLAILKVGFFSLDIFHSLGESNQDNYNG